MIYFQALGLKRPFCPSSRNNFFYSRDVPFTGPMAKTDLKSGKSANISSSNAARNGRHVFRRKMQCFISEERFRDRVFTKL